MNKYNPPTIDLFGSRLKSLRQGAGFKSMPECCRAIKIPLTTWAKYENGYRFPKLDSLVVIANFFKVCPLWIVGVTDNPNNLDVRALPEDDLNPLAMAGAINGRLITHTGDIFEITSRLIERGQQ